jgi:hypothetical protein
MKEGQRMNRHRRGRRAGYLVAGAGLAGSVAAASLTAVKTEAERRAGRHIPPQPGTP